MSGRQAVVVFLRVGWPGDASRQGGEVREWDRIAVFGPLFAPEGQTPAGPRNAVLRKPWLTANSDCNYSGSQESGFRSQNERPS